MSFITDDFMLQNKPGRILYHEYAKKMPIFDYHCHLPPAQVAENTKFSTLTEIWLSGDHYKWRAMRTNGIEEKLITGSAPDYDRFMAWAKTVPYTIRNPLYHWTHMELADPFGIRDRLLGPDTAEGIYNECNAMLQQENFSTRGIMKHFDVRVACTTDDPADDLSHHRAIAEDTGFDIKVLPTFRPDKAFAINNSQMFNPWIRRLEEASGISIISFDTLMQALEKRHRYFHENGCRLSDYGIEAPFYMEATRASLDETLQKGLKGQNIEGDALAAFRTTVMHELAQMHAESGWTMQIHMGAMRNNNTRYFWALGPDSGFDSMGDFELARPLSRFLDSLDVKKKLPRTILYVLNPRDNEMMATMMGNFQDGSIPGKIQFGSGWWFNDQKDGIIRQLDALSNMGLLSRFVGMLTDSRSFLSYTRHDYFRRILCNLVGQDVKNGELPADLPFLGDIIQNICYNNAVNYFSIDGTSTSA